ncbi:hypothetical protein A3H38_04080 [candidate division WOR-1 bacterium RIFCSPLOWO2_02_FULL_46_20]|uniref:Uncharacterized protein n=2 Tax=Saganbacteria TaxID=1703751 RepID=A0A1F4RHL0_UNCSA|nr:MAG: hypothetical protein A3J44_01545 [candidate division WOR-1 bacterium RIFCSPHIGHO2_02_FULL_45_12]OGC07667.1 MAG: hypothetical protein A3H38_04080 [candidate division WOR-1 bacterium RIFCSPLOWO2_02_FULL_46_20]OGC08239.1 MAG: hypothetical protein A3F86_05630 [candidate division WOR-1 bacterium RIFCSPLOWO2_12_FULL_45_9]
MSIFDLIAVVRNYTPAVGISLPPGGTETCEAELTPLILDPNRRPMDMRPVLPPPIATPHYTPEVPQNNTGRDIYGTYSTNYLIDSTSSALGSGEVVRVGVINLPLSTVNNSFPGGHEAGNAFIRACIDGARRVSSEIFNIPEYQVEIARSGPTFFIRIPEGAGVEVPANFIADINAALGREVAFSYEFEGLRHERIYNTATDGRERVASVGIVVLNPNIGISEIGIGNALDNEGSILNQTGSNEQTAQRLNEVHTVTAEEAMYFDGLNPEERVVGFEQINDRAEPVRLPEGHPNAEPQSRLPNINQVNQDGIMTIESGHGLRYATLDGNVFSSFGSLGAEVFGVGVDGLIELRVAEAASRANFHDLDITISRYGEGSEEFFITADAERVTAETFATAIQDFMVNLNEPFEVRIETGSLAQSEMGPQYLADHPDAVTEDRVNRSALERFELGRQYLAEYPNAIVDGGVERSVLEASELGRSFLEAHPETVANYTHVDLTDCLRRSIRATGTEYHRGFTITLAQGVIMPRPDLAPEDVIQRATRAINALGEAAKALNPNRQNFNVGVRFVGREARGLFIAENNTRVEFVAIEGGSPEILNISDSDGNFVPREQAAEFYPEEGRISERYGSLTQVAEATTERTSEVHSEVIPGEETVLEGQRREVARDLLIRMGFEEIPENLTREEFIRRFGERFGNSFPEWLRELQRTNPARYNEISSFIIEQQRLNFGQRGTVAGSGLAVGIISILATEEILDIVGLENEAARFATVIGVAHVANVSITSGIQLSLTEPGRAQLNAFFRNPSSSLRTGLGEINWGRGAINIFSGVGQAIIVTNAYYSILDSIGVSQDSFWYSEGMGLGVAFGVPFAVSYGGNEILLSLFGESTAGTVGTVVGEAILPLAITAFACNSLNFLFSNYERSVNQRAGDMARIEAINDGTIGTIGTAVSVFFDPITGTLHDTISGTINDYQRQIAEEDANQIAQMQPQLIDALRPMILPTVAGVILENYHGEARELEFFTESGQILDEPDMPEFSNYDQHLTSVGDTEYYAIGMNGTPEDEYIQSIGRLEADAYEFVINNPTLDEETIIYELTQTYNIEDPASFLDRVIIREATPGHHLYMTEIGERLGSLAGRLEEEIEFENHTEDNIYECDPMGCGVTPIGDWRREEDAYNDLINGRIEADGSLLERDYNIENPEDFLIRFRIRCIQNLAGAIAFLEPDTIDPSSLEIADNRQMRGIFDDSEGGILREGNVQSLVSWLLTDQDREIILISRRVSRLSALIEGAEPTYVDHQLGLVNEDESININSEEYSLYNISLQQSIPDLLLAGSTAEDTH